MKTAKHFALVALFVLATATPAVAQPPSSLYPVGDEPNASGMFWHRWTNGPLIRLSCNNLTPGETYYADAYGFGYFGEFVADKNGKGTIDWTQVSTNWLGEVLVFRADGTLVLSSMAP